MIIKGQEFHNIIENVFGDVKGLNVRSQLQVNCPRCMERDGLFQPDGKFNLEINTEKRVYHCWKCHTPSFSGSLGRLIRTFGNHSDYELYKSYAGSYNYNYFEVEDQKEYIPVKLPEEMIFFSRMNASDPEHFEAYNYLINDRKIPYDVILKYRLGFCTTGEYEKMIIIPSYDAKGEINYFVGRRYDVYNKKKKKPPYNNPKSDKNVIIFNEGYINWDSTVYLVEGVFDMLSFPVNTIPLLGKRISSKLFLKLKELKPNVIVLLDPDAYNDAINLVQILKSIYYDCQDKIKAVFLPKNKKNEDLDEIRKNKGISEVIKYLRTARDLNIDDYFTIKLSKF